MSHLKNMKKLEFRGAFADDGCQTTRTKRQRGHLSAWMALATIILLGTAWSPADAAEGNEDASQFNNATPRSQANVLENVVVTAQRRQEDVQSAAVSIDVSTPEELANASVTTASGLTALVPGLQASDMGGYTVFYLRGIGAFALNAFSESAVAFNLNGTYMARPNGVDGQFFDIERVEVLKGPQGTLYGRNATGGAINVISRRPELGEFGGYLEAQVGNYDKQSFTGVVNMPVSDGTALRVAFQTDDRDGYFDDGTSDADTSALRVSLGAEPSEKLSINVIADYTSLEGRSIGGAILLPSDTIPLRSGLNNPEVDAIFNDADANTNIFPGAITPLPHYLNHKDVELFGLTAEFNLETETGTLTVIPSYRETSWDQLNTSNGSWVIDEGDQHQTSFELRFASNTDSRIQYVAGAYYLKESSDFQLPADTQFSGVVTLISDLSTETAAAFGQASFSVTDEFRVIAGLRYTWEEKNFDGTQNVSAPAVFTSGPGLNPLVIGPSTTVTTVDQAKTFDATTGKVGFEWDAGSNSLVYANIGTGFKAGGFFYQAGDATFDPEEVTSFVVGTKNRFLAGRLELNAEAFFVDYRDQQLAHIGYVTADSGDPTIAFPTENVGKSTIAGVDAAVRMLVAENTLLKFGVNYMKSEYDEFTWSAPDISVFFGPPGIIPPATGCDYTLAAGEYTIDCSGRQLLHTPTWTVTAGFSHTFDLSGGGSIVAGVDSRHQSAAWLGDTFLPEARGDSSTRTDAYVSFETRDGKFSLAAYVNNIEDDDVFDNVFVGPTYPIFPFISGALRAPRVYGLRARMNF